MRKILEYSISFVTYGQEVICVTIEECRLSIQAHRQKVRKYIRFFTDRLTTRGEKHDLSKLQQPELSLFAQYTDCLKDLTYGSPEYYKNLQVLKPALDHHYANNKHHPEHYKDGVLEMTLIDILEMLADWKAASERHKDGNLLFSIEKNAQRFHIDDQLKQILLNTAKILDEIE